jgi:poly(A) polymerase
VGGQKDLADKIIRAIGDPHLRIKEDRLRMIRALRLKCRFHFSIDQSTQEAIHAHAQELFPSVAIERIVQELNKSLKTNSLVCMLKELDQFKLLEQIFPELNTRPIAPLLEPLLHYPRKTPLIIYLLALFPQIDLSTQTTLCKRLKISQTDQQLARFLLSTKLEINANNQELYTWAYIYANPLSYITLEIIKAHLSPSEKEDFHKTHQSRREHLKRSIERIQRLNPIVSSQDLMEEGIVPSHTMGLLLKAAETIAINEQIEEKEVIIQKLKTLPIWP